MKNLAFAVLVASALVLNAQIGEPDAINWVSKDRQQWGEQPLREYHNTREIYRVFLWTPFWGQAVSRVMLTGKERAELVTKTRGYQPSDKVAVNSRSISKAELTRFVELLDKTEFWTMPTNEVQNHRAKDSDACIVEGVKNGKYHAVRGEISSPSPFADACSLFTREAMKESLHPAQGH